VNFKRISVTEAKAMLAAQPEQEPVQVVDIRDEESYAQGHLPAAVHLHNANMQEFIQSADLDAPLLVYCYHGHMSQSAAAWLAEQGFEQAYSLDGGYADWELEAD
jgi:thiosulfate sulfurtransferase